MSHSVFETARNWEISHAEAMARSEARAWWVARVALLAATLALVAVAALAPLKTTIPYVVYVDRSNGETQVVSVLSQNTIAQSDLQSKHWAVEYVRARERYQWNLLQFDYDTVLLLSDTNIGRDYSHLFEGPDALDKRFGASTEARV